MNRIEIGAVKLHQAICAAFPRSNTSRFISAVITAAGSGERMGGVSKQFALLNGQPCILYSLRAFQDSEQIREIVVVAKKEEEKMIRDLAKAHGITKLSCVADGGKSRAESVRNGFLRIDPKADLVAIHDGDRPLITSGDIDLVIRDAIRYGAASAARVVTDSVKRGDDKGMIAQSVPRDGLFTVQTPQIFLTDMYRVSLALADKSGVSYTDDNALCEQAGFKVKLTVLTNENDKLTFKEDAARIERVLRERNG